MVSYNRHKPDRQQRLPIADLNTKQVWTSDIMYLWTNEGWLYLAIVLDLFNREVIGWSMKPRMTMVWFHTRREKGVMHRSDRRSQYASHAFQDILKKFGMTCSMSSRGNRWDNAPT